MPAVAVDFGQILVCRTFAVVAAKFLVVSDRANAHFVPAFVVIFVRHNLEKPPLLVKLAAFSATIQ
jgi:hypothetical protein